MEAGSLAESDIEQIQSEVDDLDASYSDFEIVTYPADYTFEQLAQRMNKGLIKVPGFQRKFVWTQNQASRLIESLIIGLPVPSVFLFVDPEDNSHIVVDGQQRLTSIKMFYNGVFGEEAAGKQTVFRLTGLSENSPFNSKTYKELEGDRPSEFNKLNDAVIRAFIVKQITPNNNESVYHIFERLNTGGTLLTSQEIRNCVYHGRFNNALIKANENSAWRDVCGRAEPDRRMRDVELLLRALALAFNTKPYEKPMKDYLSDFMGENRQSPHAEEWAVRASEAASRMANALGKKPFHIRAGLNATALDAVMAAFLKHPDVEVSPEDLKSRYGVLLKDEAFLDAITNQTTDVDKVKTRISKAEEILFEATRVVG